MNKAPCYQCSERYEGCHSLCEKYIVYRAQRLEVYKERERSKKRSIDIGANIRRDITKKLREQITARAGKGHGHG